MADSHEFNNSVVAILDGGPEIGKTVGALEAAGYELEVLAGAEGIEHLDPNEGGDEDKSFVRSLLAAFGDQRRIIEQLTDALAEGKTVVSVTTDPEEAAEAARILTEHGGHYVWKFGEWTYSRIATLEEDAN